MGRSDKSVEDCCCGCSSCNSYRSDAGDHVKYDVLWTTYHTILCVLLGIADILLLLLYLDL